jgi:hypothetical protein
MEEIGGIFSSPRKPSPLRKSFHAHEVDSESSTPEHSVGMVGMDSMCRERKSARSVLLYHYLLSISSLPNSSLKRLEFFLR